MSDDGITCGGITCGAVIADYCLFSSLIDVDESNEFPLIISNEYISKNKLRTSEYKIAVQITGGIMFRIDAMLFIDTA